MPVSVKGDVSPGRQLFLELIQESRTVESLLYHIVRSKRLLADHIELLETCNLPADNAILSAEPTRNYFTLLRTIGLVSASVVSLNYGHHCWPMVRYVLPATAAVYSSFYGVKAVFTFKRMRLERSVSDLIADLDDADSAIRKNISYLREENFLRGLAKDKCASSDGIARKCLESMIKLIQLIYNEVQSLERLPLPEHVEAKYQPLEDLSECIYFQRNVADFGADDIKEFFNIYLYFQSQLLIRLCLIIIYRSHDAFTYLQQRAYSLRSAIQSEIVRLTESVSYSGGQSLLRDKLQALKSANSLTAADSLAVTRVKRGSLDLMCRLLAMTNAYCDTDDRIQSLSGDHRLKKDVFMQIAQRMTQIEQSLVTCQEDYRRLKLTYDKFLFTTFRIKPERKMTAAVNEEASDNIISDDAEIDAKNRPQNQNDEENSDFFALRDSDEVISENDDAVDKLVEARGNLYDELEQLDLKLSRNYFAPVLKQLKSKINPLHDAMKERELKFLLAKGFDRDRIVGTDADTTTQDDALHGVDSNSDSDVSIVMPRSKPRNNYDEMRSFLQQKQQFAMIPPSLPPTHAPADEDVIE